VDTVHMACQQSGPGQFRVSKKKITVLEPIQLVGMDFMGPIDPPALDGSRYILVVVDYYSNVP
jgi:hypothetical protein